MVLLPNKHSPSQLVSLCACVVVYCLSNVTNILSSQSVVYRLRRHTISVLRFSGRIAAVTTHRLLLPYWLKPVPTINARSYSHRCNPLLCTHDARHGGRYLERVIVRVYSYALLLSKPNKFAMSYSLKLIASPCLVHFAFIQTRYGLYSTQTSLTLLPRRV
jgi:hypothetical protein